MNDPNTLVPLALVVTAAAALLLAALLVDIWHRRRLAVRRRVVVSTLGGDAFSGILWARRGPYLVLRDVTVHSGGNTVAADGDVILDRAVIAFVQAFEAR